MSLPLKMTLRGTFILQLMALLVTSLMGQEGTLKWSFKTPDQIEATPAIGLDNVIYAGSRDRNLYAINPDGTEKWRYHTGEAVIQPPAVGADGTIYAASLDSNLHALNPDGTLQWMFVPDPPGVTLSEMAIAADGTIYYAVSKLVYAVNPDGSEFWSFDASLLVEGISIGNDGTILVGVQSTARVLALSPQGVELWRFDGGPGSLQAAPALDEDGGLYFGKKLAKDQFFALNPDGSQKWNVGIDVVVVNTPVGVFSPAIGASGDVYFPVNADRTHGLLVCLDAEDGSEKWRFETDGGLQSSPLVGFDETIYIGTRSNKLIAINPDGTQRWVFDMPTGSILSSPPIADNGTLYFGSNDTRLYAVNTSSTGLSVGSWPKHQRDVRNTGRLGSDITRRRWFAPHVYWLDEENNAVVIISNIGKAQNPAGTASSRSPAGIGATTASFRIDVLNRDGSVFFSIEDSVDPGETKEFVLAAPDNSLYAGAAIIDSAVRDGLFLAPFLTWNLDVSAQLEPLAIGAFFSDPTDAAQLHHFPAEASASNGLGIGVQNRATIRRCVNSIGGEYPSGLI